MKASFVLLTLFYIFNKGNSLFLKNDKAHCPQIMKKFSEWGAYPTDLFDYHMPKFVNNRPTIGVVAMEVMGQKMLVEAPWSEGKDYFGSSFVKLIQGAGGRAVPIVEDISEEDLAALLLKINGAIIPGGDADLSDSGYARVTAQILEHSKRQAKKGITFPVIGICRGAQMMMVVEAGKDFLIETDALNLSLPLTFTKEASKSKLFGKAPKGLVCALKNEPITFNAHALGIPSESFYNNTDLTKAFRALSTNFDRNGTDFISTFEAREAPIFGFQWHPEKVLYVFNPVLAVDHTIHATFSAQYIANFLITEARKNPNRFDGRIDEEKHLIFNYHPSYVGNITETPYEEIYLFDFKPPFKKLEEEQEEKEKKKAAKLKKKDKKKKKLAKKPQESWPHED